MSVSLFFERSHPRQSLTKRPARQPAALSLPTLPSPHLSQNRHVVPHQPKNRASYREEAEISEEGCL